MGHPDLLWVDLPAPPQPGNAAPPGPAASVESLLPWLPGADAGGETEVAGESWRVLVEASGAWWSPLRPSRGDMDGVSALPSSALDRPHSRHRPRPLGTLDALPVDPSPLALGPLQTWLGPALRRLTGPFHPRRDPGSRSVKWGRRGAGGERYGT